MGVSVWCNRLIIIFKVKKAVHSHHFFNHFLIPDSRYDNTDNHKNVIPVVVNKSQATGKTNIPNGNLISQCQKEGYREHTTCPPRFQQRPRQNICQAATGG